MTFLEIPLKKAFIASAVTGLYVIWSSLVPGATGAACGMLLLLLRAVCGVAGALIFAGIAAFFTSWRVVAKQKATG